MYGKLTLAAKYLRFFFTSSARKGNGVHSPFVFEFSSKVLNDKQPYDDYDKVETLRARLLKDQRIISVEDLGAGSARTKTSERSISSIAKSAGKPKKFGQLLYRMIKYYRPQNILELGTSLGITTGYLSLGNPGARIDTLEGSATIADIAKTNLGNLQLSNWQLETGNFDDTLDTVLQQLPAVDFAFIDGNHRLEPTKKYFQKLLRKACNDSIFVFDDIHWSAEMEAAWKYMKEHPEVSCTIDLFFMGIVFFRKEFLEKQDFKIMY